MISSEQLLSKYASVISSVTTFQTIGKITQVIGLVLESDGPQASLGEVCILRGKDGQELGMTEVVGFRDNKILSMILGDILDIAPGTEIVSTGFPLSVGVGYKMLGRVLDGLGNPLDGLPKPEPNEFRSVYAKPPNPLSRKRIEDILQTGVRAIDGLLTIGMGQRMGIFAGSGVGKSTLMGMISRNTSADISVICLVGERGREVKEFIENELGPKGLERAIIVVATSDQPALVRIKSALVATTIAEYFRDEGFNVMLMMDSITRLAMAQREVGLTIGEPPATKGYTPSVFSLLPKIMERAGTSERGTITALYTVLVEGDDFNEPIADAARGILDGHIVLSRKLASQNHYPSIDVLDSISRVMKDICDEEHIQTANKTREALSRYRESEDLITIGAYQKGSNSLLDQSIRYYERMIPFLQQGINENVPYVETIERLQEIIQ